MKPRNYLLPKSLLVFTLVTLTSVAAFSWPTIPWFDDDKPPAKKISKFHPLLPVDSECEKILLSAEASMGREMTEEEIDRNLLRILEKTGESLMSPPTVEPEPAPAPVPGTAPAPAPQPVNLRDTSAFHETLYSYFPGEAEVLTSEGYIKIKDLTHGYRVMSYDLTSQKLAPKNIVTIGQLRQIEEFAEITFDGETLLTGVATVLISPGNDLSLLELEANSLTSSSASLRGTKINVERGNFITSVKGVSVTGLTKVLRKDIGYFIELQGKPANIVVNGLLVKSTPDLR